MMSAVVIALILAMPMVVGAAPRAEDAPPIVAAPPQFGAPLTVRAAYGLRLRVGPSLGDPIILVLRNGETVYPGGGPVWGDGLSWTFVRVYRGGRHHEGFAATMYLSGAGTGAQSVRVTAGAGLRLRAGPGLNHAILGVAPYGAVMESTGVTQWGSGLQWSLVRVGGYYYWSASKYLAPA